MWFHVYHSFSFTLKRIEFFIIFYLIFNNELKSTKFILCMNVYGKTIHIPIKNPFLILSLFFFFFFFLVLPWSKLRILTQRPFYSFILWWLDMMRILLSDQSWNFSPMWNDYFTILSVVWLKINGFDCLQNWVSTYAPVADLLKVNTNSTRKYHISWPNQTHNHRDLMRNVIMWVQSSNHLKC